MKAVMISIQPKWCELIANCEKTIEVRKTRPKINTPFKCYIYCTVSGATKNCSENEKGRKNLLIDYCRDSILDDRQVITQDLKGRRQLGKHTTQAFNYGTVLNGKVIGEFVCDKIIEIKPCFEYYRDFYDIDDDTLEETCLTREELHEYGKGKPLYAWHISDLEIYDEPKELNEFSKPCSCIRCQAILIHTKCDREWRCNNYITSPPQSWGYCEELEEK